MEPTKSLHGQPKRMRYYALALDYDGTLATQGKVSAEAIEALERFQRSGRSLILVTGRELKDLIRIFPNISLFDRVVAENGAVLYRPSTREEKPLGPPPPDELVTALQKNRIPHLSIGQVIISSWEPHEKAIIQTIHQLGLEYYIVFNKGAVMVLPSGINKATGLSEGLNELGISPHNTVGVGDAENDHAFLNLCECSIAVSNALDSIKKRVDGVTSGEAGGGVIELIDQLIATDLWEKDENLKRHYIRLGTADNGDPVELSPYGHNILLCGTSGGGKSTLATGFLERLAEAHYQFCIIDPEGDYGAFDKAPFLGDNRHAPGVEEVIKLLEKQSENIVVNLLAVPLKDRPHFFEGLFIRIQELRARLGRPHWILIDEAHHLFPSTWNPVSLIPQEFYGLFFITVHPDHVAIPLLSAVDVLISLGQNPESGLRSFGETLKENVPSLKTTPLKTGEAWLWFRRKGIPPLKFSADPPHMHRRRHLRKYADGYLDPDRSFYFRGPTKKFNLRAQNLQMFIQIAEGLDDETWSYHLFRGDYSRWFRECIKDTTLADTASLIEKNKKISAMESRNLIKATIEDRYTASA